MRTEGKWKGRKEGRGKQMEEKEAERGKRNVEPKGDKWEIEAEGGKERKKGQSPSYSVIQMSPV